MTPTNLPPHTPPPKSTSFPQTLDSTPTRPISAKRPNPFLDSESILLSTPTKLMKPLAHKSATLSIRDELNIIQLKMKKYDREFHTRLITQIPTGDMVEEHRIRMLELQDLISDLAPPLTKEEEEEEEEEEEGGWVIIEKLKLRVCV
ncbi:hypothetical protein ACMFMF_008107 [Clarireedia jacksonii]